MHYYQNLFVVIRRLPTAHLPTGNQRSCFYYWCYTLNLFHQISTLCPSIVRLDNRITLLCHFRKTIIEPKFQSDTTAVISHSFKRVAIKTSSICLRTLPLAYRSIIPFFSSSR